MPKHVGIIIDGNGRWAQNKGLSRSLGHLEGSKNVRNIVNVANEIGIKYLTIYAFSTDNFKRSKEEVDYLMDLFVRMFKEYKKDFKTKNVQFAFSGRKQGLPNKVIKAIDDLLEYTKDCTGNVINLCVNYGGQEEIIDATKKILCKVAEGKLNLDDLTKEDFYHYLYNDIPPADLIIRTGGEYRLSNFLTYQSTYAELFFTETLFPAFNKEEFVDIINSFKNRDRRFGGIKYEKKETEC